MIKIVRGKNGKSKEVCEGKAMILPEGGDWVLKIGTNGFLSLGAVANVSRWKNKKIRITIEEVR
jgi:hypothetical protein